ncbi:pectin lyase fold/virulence factor [Geopyxis carbonaria]|nr:pectin lyase fold/virulence factor [Geopyxis carbonaria]
MLSAVLSLALFTGAAFSQLLEGTAVGPTTSLSEKSRQCSVLDYGGVADGKTDIGAAISKAFSDCVVSGAGAATLVVPEGDYYMSTGVILNGGTRWAFRLDGLITLSPDGDFGGNAIVIKRASDFEMFSSNGLGAIQGNGYQQRTSGSAQNARLLRFMTCESYSVHDLILIDAPTFHMVHNNAVNLEAYHITVRGGNKGGLDGIDLICDSNCYLHHMEVTNRDECISVKTPSKNVLIEDIYCNQSGGMSIGSLDAADGAQIELVTMRRIYVHQCTQMLMIKTFPGGSGANGYVKDSVFEDFWAHDTTYALDIDQYWYNHDDPNTGAIELSNLVFRNWTGTVDNGVNRGPIVIRGSDVVPLTNITLEDFSMWTVNGDSVVLQCQNVYGTGYCAGELADGVSPTAFTSALTITTPMSGYAEPTSPVWGVGTAGFGTTESIPVYTPAAMWAVDSVQAKAAATSADATTEATALAVPTSTVLPATTPTSKPKITVAATSTSTSSAVEATTKAVVTSSSTFSATSIAPVPQSASVSTPALGWWQYPQWRGAPGRAHRW